MIDTLRHFLAALAYRFQGTVDDAPDDFGDFQAGHGVRTPAEILRHMTHVLRFAHSRFAAGTDFSAPEALPFSAEVERFHTTLALLDRDFETVESPETDLLERLLQGPLADTMTHVGQLAMLRRMAGSPITGLNFYAADLRAGQVGPRQAS